MIEVLKWIGIALLALLAIGAVLAGIVFVVIIIQVLREPDEYTVSVCTLDYAPCDAPKGTPCSCCGKYQYFEEQGNIS